MTYQLWDMDSGNMLVAYHSEGEALAFVRDVTAEYGDEVVAEWDLLAVNGRESAKSVAAGNELAARAKGQVITAA